MDEPNYARMEALLVAVAEENHIEEEAPFDWDENFAQVLREDHNAPKQLSSMGGTT